VTASDPKEPPASDLTGADRPYRLPARDPTAVAGHNRVDEVPLDLKRERVTVQDAVKQGLR